MFKKFNIHTITQVLLKKIAERQILTISLSFKEVLNCGHIHILHILQSNLQFTPIFQDDGMFDVAYVPNSTHVDAL